VGDSFCASIAIPAHASPTATVSVMKNSRMSFFPLFQSIKHWISIDNSASSGKPNSGIQKMVQSCTKDFKIFEGLT
jgi:hypothetical protein